MANKKQEFKLGLWQKKSEKWLVYYQGYKEFDWQKIRVTLFKNTNKTNDKQPDLNIIVELEEEDPADVWPEEEIPF